MVYNVTGCLHDATFPVSWATGQFLKIFSTPASALRGLRNKGTSKRSPTRPCGEERYPSVFLGKTLACRTLVVLFIAQALGVVWLLEQPRGSMMEIHPAFQYFLSRVSAWRHSLSMGDYGARTPKPTWLYSGPLDAQRGFVWSTGLFKCLAIGFHRCCKHW